MRNIATNKNICVYILVLSFAFFSSLLVYAEPSIEEQFASNKQPPIQVTTLGGYNDDDTRHLYEVNVIRLILEKTEAQFGPFELKEARGMTHSDSIDIMSGNKEYPNFVRSFGFTPEMESQENLKLIPFPLWRGLLGYRTCFLSDRIVNSFAAAKTLQELREFSHGQGTGWIDADILRYNDFQVKEVSAYTSLFKMVAKNRFDLFCRGANEVREEFGRFSYIHGLEYDRSKVFYYPFPHFLFTHADNTALAERLEAGAEIIVKDGSFEKYWSDYFKNNIRFINFSTRQYVRLENPFMKDFDLPYEHLIYKPESAQAQP